MNAQDKRIARYVALGTMHLLRLLRKVSDF